MSFQKKFTPMCWIWAGVEGTMRACSEETLRVLREHKELFLTLIEVLIHDPLYKWALTINDIQRRQQTDDATTNDPATENQVLNADAEVTLLKIRHKLEGLDSGTARPTPLPISKFKCSIAGLHGNKPYYTL